MFITNTKIYINPINNSFKRNIQTGTISRLCLNFIPLVKEHTGINSQQGEKWLLTEGIDNMRDFYFSHGVTETFALLGR